MTLSACAELSAHLIKMADARDAIEAARQPLRELDDRIAAVKAAERSDEQALAAIQQDEADDVVRSRAGKTRDFTKEIAQAVTRLDRTKRAVQALEARRPEVERPLRDAELSLSVLNSGTEALIAAVVAEHADDVLAALVDAREKAARAESAARTLAGHVAQRGWLPLAEKINVRLYEMSHPAWDRQPFPAWDKWTAALAVDANATPAVPR